ncbi:MAG: hypothetical protein JO170_01340 [Verrucomicrobia bacterium]|nr:hypothetical protein [Verrucomicrobiota bacterium]
MNHYTNSAVRARIAEFLGVGCNGSNPTAVEFATSDEATHLPCLPRSFAELSTSLLHNLEIFRSLWDRDSLLADLEIKYVNFDDPALPYTDYARTFALQEPLRRETQKALLGFGIAPLHLLSGRGHRFLWRIRRGSGSFARLANLGRMPPSLRAHYDQRSSPGGEKVDHTLGNAFVGLGRIMEYFAAEVKKRVAPILRLPIELSDIEVGPGERGREMISFDISQYADPLYARFTRVAYSRYLRASEQLGRMTDETASSLPSLFVIPLYEMSVDEALQVMHAPEAVAALASYAPANIPDCSDGTGNLLNSYLSSELAQFHCDFYAGEPEPPERWPETYDRIDLDQLPPCVQFLLLNPNDLLLRSSSMRRVVLTLLSLGWHPRHIAGLIQSRFEHDFGWNNHWVNYDPATKAEFFTRVFAGLVIGGYDDLVDFNCCSTQEQKICFQPRCQDNLERFRTSLLNRRNYGRLARRPFHRLFLPGEHPELS